MSTVITSLKYVLDQYVLFVEDNNGREIRVFHLENVKALGQTHYPSVTLMSHGQLVNPINERVMSLPTLSTPEGFVFNLTKRVQHDPVFFFVYNVDNYYHFLYDTLPYLITFQHLKRVVPQLKLLTNFANSQQTKLNRFVLEFLDLLGIQESDLLFLDRDTEYRSMYLSSSYTHDGLSNAPPRQEVYDLYADLAKRVPVNDSLPRKLYVSRRSYKHGQVDNIGTNYTTKRNFANESELVAFLESRGYVEVFTELLTTRDKIALFKTASHVVGPIGGGLCNILFSSPITKLTAIVSPHFLDINKRFCYSFANVNVGYFDSTRHIETSEYKKYMRVRVKSLNVIGEIVDIFEDSLGVLYSNEVVAGWNAQTQYTQVVVNKNDVEVLDPGLNAAWQMDLNKFMETVNV